MAFGSWRRWWPPALPFADTVVHRERYAIQNQLIAGQLTAEVQARGVPEQFPNTIIYISDIRPAPPRIGAHFLADVTPSRTRQQSRVTLARKRSWCPMRPEPPAAFLNESQHV